MEPKAISMATTFLLKLATFVIITLLVASTASGAVKERTRASRPRDGAMDDYRGDSANVSRLLDSLLRGYDMRLRPNYSGDPVDVDISMHVSSISQISEANMDFTLDFYFRQHWTDHRLDFSDSGEDELCISNQMLGKIWWPDTFFANAKQANFHTATTHNAFLRIKPNGTITQSLRLTVTAMCSMDLTYFPMDSQICSLAIESYAYSIRHIMYRWINAQKSVKINTNVKLPQFRVRGINARNETEITSTGSYSRLYCDFYLVRSLGYYIIHIYVPSCLIVVLSWISFWLHRDASPARVALGITTVLTMTTILSSSNASLPKISYLKSIDIFLVTCFSMVFASLLEYACVSFIARMKPPTPIGPGVAPANARPGGRRPPPLPPGHQHDRYHQSTAGGIVKRRRSNDTMVTSRLLEMESSIGGDGGHVTDIPRPGQNGPAAEKQYESASHEIGLTSTSFGANCGGNGGTRDLRTPLSCRPLAAANQCPAHSGTARCYDRGAVSSIPIGCGKIPGGPVATASTSTAPPKEKMNRNAALACTIDKYSRVVFPVVFIAFNVIYWVIFLNISQFENESDFVIVE